MLAAKDLIRLPYTSDLTEAGIQYACRSLAYTYNRMGGTRFERLRRIASGKAVELALRRHLQRRGVPHSSRGATAFTDPDGYDLAFGERRCDVKSFQLFDPELVQRVRRDPALLLQASALVPCDQAASGRLDDGDIYLFAFSTARVPHAGQESQDTREAGQPAFFIYPLPQSWAHPAAWQSLGRLSLTSGNRGTLTLDLGGQNRRGLFQTECIRLALHSPVHPRSDYYSLAYLHAQEIPAKKISLYSPALGQTCRVLPGRWGNIWVSGIEVILAGYISRQEFRRRSRYLPAGSRVFQYAHTSVANYALPLAQLHPIQELLTAQPRPGNPGP